MMRYFVTTLIIISCCIFYSCSNNQLEKVERLKVQVEILNPDLEIQYAGNFLVTHKCLVLQDPFRPSGVIKLLDTESGNEIFSFIDIGQGPQEFVTPMFNSYFNNLLNIFDVNSLKKAQFDLDSLYEGKISINPTRLYQNDIIYLIMLGDNEFVAGVMGNENPFCFIQNDSSMYEFGNYPIQEDITNAFNVFQGTILYNNERNIMGYATFHTPYLSLYEYKEKAFSLLWETRFAKAKYYISNHNLRWENNHVCGISGFAFTRDYIACMVKEMYDRDATGRSKENMARAIYLYDYEGNLKKILDIDLHSLRISADPESNLVYLVGMDDGWCLARIDLQKIQQ